MMFRKINVYFLQMLHIFVVISGLEIVIYVKHAAWFSEK